MKLKLHAGKTFLPERKYIYDVVLQEFLGISYEVIFEERTDCVLELNGKSIHMNDIFFQQSESSYLQRESLPRQPLPIWQCNSSELAELFVQDTLPVIYGHALLAGEYIGIHNTDIQIGIDIFGSAFFMLTRYEEVVKPERDLHGRFSAKDSLAYQEGFLERPIINEYVELLWWSMHHSWPELQRKERYFQILPTHDMDHPYWALSLSYWQIIHLVGGDLLKRCSLTQAMQHLKTIYKVRQGDLAADPNNTFDLIMDISEKYRLQSTFFVMLAQGLSDMDGNYDVRQRSYLSLLQKIVRRGHRLGLHPSYASFHDGEEIHREKNMLQDFLQQQGLQPEAFGGRQHYLRWEAPDTWQYYEDAGLAYDTTLSYADHIGFRCGICYAFPVFNVKTRKTLKLREIPLIVMDSTVLEAQYMNLKDVDVVARIGILKRQCEKYRGLFVVLWHNTSFISKLYAEWYREIIEE